MWSFVDIYTACVKMSNLLSCCSRRTVLFQIKSTATNRKTAPIPLLHVDFICSPVHILTGWCCYGTQWLYQSLGISLLEYSSRPNSEMSLKKVEKTKSKKRDIVSLSHTPLSKTYSAELENSTSTKHSIIHDTYSLLKNYRFNIQLHTVMSYKFYTMCYITIYWPTVVQIIVIQAVYVSAKNHIRNFTTSWKTLSFLVKV
jgi:hypothetical protein